jgi:hypothetical protein
MCSLQWASVSTAESFEIERTIFRVMYHQAMSTSVDLGMEFGKYDSLVTIPEGRFPARPLGEFRCRRVVRSSRPPTGRTFVPGQDSRSAQLTLDWRAHGFYFPFIVKRGGCWSCTQRSRTRKTLAGEFIVVNKKLVKMLEERDSGHEGSQEALSSTGIHQGHRSHSSRNQARTVWVPEAENSLTARYNRARTLVSPRAWCTVEAPRGKVHAYMGWNAGLRLSTIASPEIARIKAQQVQSQGRRRIMSKRRLEKLHSEEPVRDIFVCIPMFFMNILLLVAPNPCVPECKYTVCELGTQSRWSEGVCWSMQGRRAETPYLAGGERYC